MGGNLPPGGGLYLEGRFNGGFFALRVWAAYIWRGLFSEFYGIFFKESITILQHCNYCLVAFI